MTEILADIGLRSDDPLNALNWQRMDQENHYSREIRPVTQSWSRSARRRTARGSSQQDVIAQAPPLFVARLLVQETEELDHTENSRGRSPGRDAGQYDRSYTQVTLDWYSGPSRALVQTFWEYLSRKLKDSVIASTRGQVM